MTSLSSDPQAAAHVQSCLKDLYKLVRNVEDARKTSEPTLTSITATHKKIESEQKITPTNKAKLKNLYDDAIKDSSKVNYLVISLLPGPAISPRKRHLILICPFRKNVHTQILFVGRRPPKESFEQNL